MRFRGETSTASLRWKYPSALPEALTLVMDRAPIVKMIALTICQSPAIEGATVGAFTTHRLEVPRVCESHSVVAVAYRRFKTYWMVSESTPLARGWPPRIPPGCWRVREGTPLQPVHVELIASTRWSAPHTELSDTG